MFNFRIRYNDITSEEEQETEICLVHKYNETKIDIEHCNKGEDVDERISDMYATECGRGA